MSRGIIIIIIIRKQESDSSHFATRNQEVTSTRFFIEFVSPPKCQIELKVLVSPAQNTKISSQIRGTRLAGPWPRRLPAGRTRCFKRTHLSQVRGCCPSGLGPRRTRPYRSILSAGLHGKLSLWNLAACFCGWGAPCDGAAQVAPFPGCRLPCVGCLWRSGAGCASCWLAAEVVVVAV